MSFGSQLAPNWLGTKLGPLQSYLKGALGLEGGNTIFLPPHVHPVLRFFASSSDVFFFKNEVIGTSKAPDRPSHVSCHARGGHAQL